VIVFVSIHREISGSFFPYRYRWFSQSFDRFLAKTRELWYDNYAQLMQYDESRERERERERDSEGISSFFLASNITINFREREIGKVSCFFIEKELKKKINRNTRTYEDTRWHTAQRSCLINLISSFFLLKYMKYMNRANLAK